MNHLTTSTTRTEPTTASTTSRSPADTLLVIAWNDPVIEGTPGAMRADSDDALNTGRVRVFGSSECCRTGR